MTPEHHARVLMLGKGWFPEQLGGLDRYFRDLVERLPEAHGVVVGPATGAPPTIVAAGRHDMPLPRRLYAFWRATQRLADEVDIVDAHFGLYALAPLLIGKLRSKPLVVHFQGPWADENVAAGDGSRWRLLARRGLEGLVYRRADAVVVLSSAFRRLLVERYRVSPWIVHVEPPGVDLDRFSPGSPDDARARFGLAPDDFVATCVRRLTPRMGIDVLLDAWQGALPQLPAGAQLLIAGDGGLREQLEARAAASDMAGSVRILGRVDDDGLVDLYRAADVNLVPSTSFEGFGLVVLESAACGTPSIVTDTGGLPEAVTGLDPSLVVPAMDATALAERIVSAAAPGGRPARDATKRFAQRHSWAGVVERHRNLYANLGVHRQHRKTRVAYIDHVAQLSGGEIALLRLLPYLDRVQPHVVLAEDGPFADRVVQAGISVEVLPMGSRARELRKDRVQPGRVGITAVLSSAAYVAQLMWRLHQLTPDLVHTNSLKAGVYGSLAARGNGLPVVWHVRDRIAVDYLPPAAVHLIRFMTRRLATTLVANSHTTMATLNPTQDAVTRFSVLPEVINQRANDASEDNGGEAIGMVGRMAPWKGQDIFLRAFAHAFPEGEERCILVGAAMFGETEYETSLHHLAKELGIAHRTEFRGFRTDIWAELRRMHMLVHASVTPEPFGQVILEAMAAVIPVIATDAGGPAEIIKHNETGLLYPAGDIRRLASHMRRLEADPAERERLSRNARRAIRAYEPEAVAAQLQDVYQETLTKKGSSGGRKTWVSGRSRRSADA